MSSSRYSTSGPPDAQLAEVKQGSRDAVKNGLQVFKGAGSLLQTRDGRQAVGKDLTKESDDLKARLKHAYSGWKRDWEQTHPNGLGIHVQLQRPPVFKSEQRQAVKANSLGRSRQAYGSNAAGCESAGRYRY